MSGPRANGCGVVAFDNTGTLSRSVLEVTTVREDADFDAPVPEVSSTRPAALVSVALDDYGPFAAPDPLGRVVAVEGVPVHLALSNVDVDLAAARAAVEAECEVPASVVVEQVAALEDRVGASFPGESPPVGVQLVVDLEAGRVLRVVAYTTRPRVIAAEVVGLVRERGYEPHVLSGDAAHILRGVADAVAIPAERVHAYRSADGKAAVVTDLQTAGDREVVMVGDYVNDRHAFERADRSVLINEDGDPDAELARLADTVVCSIEDVPDLL